MLCTRLRYPDTDCYNKLERVINYIQGIIVLPLILSMDKYVNIKWYVDAASAVHKDMRRHTGGLITMGTGEACTQSRKQKINTKSSTEAYFFIVDNVLT